MDTYIYEWVKLLELSRPPGMGYRLSIIATPPIPLTLICVDVESR